MLLSVMRRGGRCRGGRWEGFERRGGTRSLCRVKRPSQSAYAVRRSHLSATQTVSAGNDCSSSGRRSHGTWMGRLVSCKALASRWGGLEVRYIPFDLVVLSQERRPAGRMLWQDGQIICSSGARKERPLAAVGCTGGAAKLRVQAV